MKAELRRSYAHLSGYKSDVVILSGTAIINFNDHGSNIIFLLYKIVHNKDYKRFWYIGLDAGDRIALSTRFEGAGEPPCQYDKEDRRFVLKGREIEYRSIVKNKLSIK